MLGAERRAQGLRVRAVLLREQHLRAPADHDGAHGPVVLLDGIPLHVDRGLVHVDPALLERLAVGVHVLAGGEPNHLGAEELPVPEERQPALGLLLAPRDDLGVERLAELHLLGEQHGLDHHFLGERQRRRDVVDVRARVLRGLRGGQRVPRGRAPVAQEDEPVGVARRQHGQRELDRLGQVRPAAGHLLLGPGQLGLRAERLVHEGLLAEDDQPGLIALLHAAQRLGREAIGALARRQADAVGHVEEEHHVQPVHPARHHRPQQRDEEEHHQRAAQPEGPAIAEARGKRRAPGGLAAPVEIPLDREKKGRQQREQPPQFPLERHDRALDRCCLRLRRERPGNDVRLLGAGEVHGDARLPAGRHDGVHAHLAGLGETGQPARDLRLDAPPRRGDHAGRGDPVLHREEDGIPRPQLEAGQIEAGRVQPAETVGEHDRKRDAQREVGLEEVETEEDRLPPRLFEHVDQGPSHRLHQGLAGRHWAHAERFLDHHLGKVHVPHDRV